MKELDTYNKLNVTMQFKLSVTKKYDREKRGIKKSSPLAFIPAIASELTKQRFSTLCILNRNMQLNFTFDFFPFFK